MCKHFLPLLAIAFATTQCQPATQQAVQIPYPSPKPDTGALTFLPGLVTTDSLDFNAMFSPDGKTFYFSRTIDHHYNIYSTTYDGKSWSPAVSVPFGEPGRNEADPFFAPDGNLYYISDRPRDASDTTKDFDIWYVRPQPDGRWSAPENVRAVNSDSTEYYVSFAANGNIYFSSNRTGGHGQLDIYMSKLENGQYLPPVNLGAGVNAKGDEHDPCITPDESTLFFTSDSYTGDTYGSADIYYSKKGKDGKWRPAVNAGNKINTPTYEYCSSLSPDGKYFFFSSERNVKWISTKFLPLGEDK